MSKTPIVNIGLVEKTVNYLATKPYIEVSDLMAGWSEVINQFNQTQNEKKETKGDDSKGEEAPKQDN